MKIFAVFVLLAAFYAAAGVHPAESYSPWFTASFYDLKFTLQRYSHCNLSPLKDMSLNETDYLVHQMEKFLTNGDYDSDQLANVSSLMDSICRTDSDQTYPISVAINITAFNGTEGKQTRCKAIDDALDSMYPVFRRAALNRSEPLDFSNIVFYPNASDKSNYYYLTDLINTSWIKSDTLLEHVCSITDSVKRYVQTRIAALNSTPSAPSATVTNATNNLSGSTRAGDAQRRSENQAARKTHSSIVTRILDLILGFERRMEWHGANGYERALNGLSSGWGRVTWGVNRGVRATRENLLGVFGSRVNSTSQSTTQMNSTKTPSAFNSTQIPTTRVPAVNASEAFNLTTTMAPIVAKNFSTPTTTQAPLAPIATSVTSTTRVISNPTTLNNITNNLKQNL